MDVVYPLGGRRGPHRQQEIRFAIRALLQHSTETIGRIFLVGEKPEFFDYSSDRLVHIEWNEDAIPAKELRIWLKVRKASVDIALSEKFLLSSDDHFFCSSFTPSAFPNYSNGRLSTKAWASRPETELNGYERKSSRTMKLLNAEGYADHNFDIHCPKVIDKERFGECWRHFFNDLWATSHEKNGSLLIKTTYCNFVGAEPVFRDDVKVKPSQFAWLKKNHRDLVTFSLFDKARNDEMLEFLKQLYPTASPFETDSI